MASELTVGKTLADGGTQLLPSLTFSGDPNTGIFNADINELGFTTNGSEKLRIDSAGNAFHINTAHATQTEFTEGLTKAGLIIDAPYISPSFQGGLFWRTSDNYATKPKAGIYSKVDGSAGTSLYFGTSNSFAVGINNDALVIGPSGLATFSNGIDVGYSTGSFVKLQAYDTVSVADDATFPLSSGACCSALISVYETGSGDGGIFFITYGGAAVLIASSGSVAATDSDGSMCVYKSANTHTATFKNRMGATKHFSVVQLGGYLL